MVVSLYIFILIGDGDCDTFFQSSPRLLFESFLSENAHVLEYFCHIKALFMSPYGSFLEFDSFYGISSLEVSEV